MQVVESVRSGKSVRQVIVEHVGISHTEEELAKLLQMAQEVMDRVLGEREAQSKQQLLFPPAEVARRGRPKKKGIEDIIPTSQVTLDDIEEVKRLVEGVHEVGGSVYNQLGFDNLLKRSRDKTILRDVVLSRMAQPGSKRAIGLHLEEQFDQKHDLDAIYRMMDKLHEQIPQMKELCFKMTKGLLPQNEVSMLFYDVTTLYFESEEVDEIRAYGYSKDSKFNTTQVVLALATNEDGLPIGYELFSGNTAEVKTLIKAMDGWSQYLAIKDLYFVADRAMFTKENMDELAKRGYKYVIAAKLRGLSKAKQEEIFDEDNYVPMRVGDELAWVSELEYEGKRLLVSYKSGRARKDSHQRQKVLDKLNKALGANSSARKLVTNSGVRKYTSMGEAAAYIDNGKVEREAQWDGIHGVITNDTQIDPRDALAKYARLWVIEESFRINKHNLEMRPIYHWTQKRIEAHIAICYMGFAILRNIEYRVALTKKISPREIMDTLMGVQASIHKHKVTGDLYRIPGVMKNQARKIYEAFNIHRSQNAEIYLK